VTGSAGPLVNGAGRLGVLLDHAQVEKLERLVSELLRWNKAYNLTSITDPDLILTHHLLDSLSVHPELVGTAIADVGTGAGFPGLPLAITNPQRSFTLIDAVDKKLRFVDHVIRALGLTNVKTRHARVEQLRDAGPFDTVVARAYAPMPRLLPSIATLCGPHTKVVAMKGRWPPAPGSDEAGPFPAGWQLEVARRVDVPGLDAERHLLVMRQHLPDTQSHL
jgi:16S rRNA (guanine527-N7)-methyltransferase